jgi:LacI family transcriptional regulator
MSTIKDVARLAGVGLGTASRVVSGRGSVAPATAKRVRRAIEQLNFRPSHAARSLLSGSTQMVGVYIPILKGTFYTHFRPSTPSCAAAPLVVAFDYRPISGARIEGAQFLINRDCDGLIVLSNDLLEKDIVALGREQPNIVVLNRVFESIRDQCFTADHVQGGIVAAQALLQHQHREIAVIGGPPTAPDNVARLLGFRSELSRHGIDPQTVRTSESDFSPEGGWVSAKALLASRHRFTALFCANDEMAVGVMSYFQQAGLAVPQEVRLGYDDTRVPVFSAPPDLGTHPMRRSDRERTELPCSIAYCMTRCCPCSDSP